MNKNKNILTKDDMASSGAPPQGPYFYQENGKTYLSLPSHMVSGIMNCPHYKHMMQDCANEGIPVPHHVMAKDLQAHIMTPAQYMQEERDQCIPSMDNHKTIEATSDNSPGVQGFSAATATANPRSIKSTVDSVAQTDNTDNFVVSKDTLVAYTIAVIQ